MLSLFKKLKKKEVAYIFVILIFILAQVYFDLKLPDFMSEITIIIKSETAVLADILKNGSFMMICALSSLIAGIVASYFVAKLASGFSRTLREDVFVKVTDLSAAEIKEFSSSSLITRTTNDVSQVEMILAMGSQILFRAPLTAIWAVMKILNKSWQWSSLTALAVIVILSVIVSIFMAVYPKFKVIQNLIDKLNAVTRESLSGLRVVRAFNSQKYQEAKFNDVNTDLKDVQEFVQRKFALMHPTMMLIMNLLSLGIFFIGAFMISGAAQFDKIEIFANMVVFSTYAMKVIMSFVMLTMIFMHIPRAAVSARRIKEVLDKDVSIKDGEFVPKKVAKGKVEFKNVSFKYPDADEYLLKNISFTAEPGETVAFMGSTGSGKSTLVNLIPRFYDVSEGEILVDDINVKEYKVDKLNDSIAYVSQRAAIFSGTVSYNVAYPKRKSQKQISEALRIAQAKNFVDKMPKKTSSLLARDGQNISGGQKQRISIARAIAKDANIYIFDDTFSALDYKTDLALRQSLAKAHDNKTTLIVAQRIGTIINADKILVLEKGRVAGIGTHKELLKSCKVYQEIAYSQLSKEELENV